MKPICIFYHCLTHLGNPPELSANALGIMQEQMRLMHSSGLVDAAARMIVGVNGGEESLEVVRFFVPAKACIFLHGLESRSENLTLVEIEKWVPTHLDWYVYYQHIKGATHGPGPVLDQRTLWRRCMERHLVGNWQQCVKDLDDGYESVGCHWMEPPATPATQYIWAGNFFWCKSSFLATLPSIYKRARIIESGIGAAESRYEAEVWIGNGPRPPTHRDYHGPGWNPGQVHTCATS